MMPNEELYGPLLNVIEFLGTFAFAISVYAMQQLSVSTGLEDLYVALPWPLVAVRCVI